MNLIDYTYFSGDINLPSQVLQGEGAAIVSYIERYEKEILINLLGYDLYKELKAEIDAETYSTKWDKVVNGSEYQIGGYTYYWNGLINADKQSLIAYYIYYRYVKDNITSLQSAGAVIGTTENSVRVSHDALLMAAWNRFTSLYNQCVEYIIVNQSDFDLFRYKEQCVNNQFGI